MSKAIDSPRGVVCGDRELFLYTVRLADVPGALNQVLEIFTSYGVNVVSVYTTESRYFMNRDSVEVNIIVDLTGKHFSPAQLERSLLLLTVVKEVRVTGKQLPDMLVDEIHFPLMLVDERAVIFRLSALSELIHGFKRQLGQAGDALLYHVGLNMGRGVWSALKNMVGVNKELLPSYLKYWMLLHSTAKVLDISIDWENRKAVVRVEGNYECEIGKGHGKPFSNLHRGVWAGIFSELFGAETSVETKCIAAGDPYCEFVVGRIS